MYKRLDNYIYFYAYREEKNTTFAVYAYDEKESCVIEVCDIPDIAARKRAVKRRLNHKTYGI